MNTNDKRIEWTYVKYHRYILAVYLSDIYGDDKVSK